MTERTVSIYTEPHGDVIGWFHTREQAEHWLAAHETVDPAGVQSGFYVIDAPEPKPLKPRLPAWAIRDLEAALKSAKFETAGFGLVGDIVTVKRLHGDTRRLAGSGRGNGEHNLDAFVKAETALYRESWLVPVIENLIAYGKGQTYEG